MDENPTLGIGSLPSLEFRPMSIDLDAIRRGASYTFLSPVPALILQNTSEPCILGVDEAGRGPVLGPMVYGIAYMPLNAITLLSKHGFADSKQLTAAKREELLRLISSSGSDLHDSVGWATRVMSARDISCGMLRPPGTTVYNLNAQAHDATIHLIREIVSPTLANGDQRTAVNIQEIYVDTVGIAASYQAKLSREFPGIKITVSKKADSIYPIVSAASVCAKVTRDIALAVSARQLCASVDRKSSVTSGPSENCWGSGYPSDARTTTWLKENMDPLFGWPSEVTRFSWGTVKDILDTPKHTSSVVTVDWPDDEEDANMQITSFFAEKNVSTVASSGWYGQSVHAAEL